MPNHERALSTTRGPVRARCPQCSAPVGLAADQCPACAVTRPSSGWQKVTELVLHPGGRDQDLYVETPELSVDAPAPAPPVSLPSRSPDPQVNTVYLQAVSQGSSHLGRLALTFAASFGVTTVFVLGTWAVLVALRPAPPLHVPRIEVIQVDRPVPVPVPVPVAVPESSSARLSPVQVLPAPEPPPVLAAAPAPRVVAPVVVPEEPPVVDLVLEPLPVVVPEPAPVPAPAPVVREAPAAASALAGAYRGKGNGRALTLHLRFLPDGVLSATVERFDGTSTLTAKAGGEYELVGTAATIVLKERGVPVPIVYSGTVTAGAAEGRMTEGGRNAGKFSVQK